MLTNESPSATPRSESLRDFQPRRKNSRRSLSAAAAALLTVAALGLSGCVASGSTTGSTHFDPWGSTQATSSKPTKTPAASQEVSAESAPVGAVISKAQAHTLRDISDPPANGDYAYAMPDGTWVKTNLNQPLPAAVEQAEQAKVDSTVVLPADLTGASYGAAGRSAQAAAASSTYSTGKLTIVLAQELYAIGDMSGNHLTWQAFGAVNPVITSANRQGGWSSGGAAKAAVQALLAGDPQAAQYEIFAAVQ